MNRTSLALSIPSQRHISMIDPLHLIQSYGIDGLCETAENYYRCMPASSRASLLAKPFNSPHNASTLMTRLGTVLSGLRIAPGMTVLDFGCGSCWISRILAQMGCKAIALDPSQTALDIGKEMFERLPLIGPYAITPDFVHFDGRQIPLLDQSVDRVISFDAFHHVPNPEEILIEIARIMKPGGIFGICEPIGAHSVSGSSQHEMAVYKVLENDLDIDWIYQVLRDHGFDQARLRMTHSDEFFVNLEDRGLLFKKERRFHRNPLKDAVFIDAGNVIKNLGIVHFHKGSFRPDSRFEEGLSANIQIPQETYELNTGQALHLDFKVTNSGASIWLHDSPNRIGRVQVGFNLFDINQNLVRHCFHSCPFTKDVQPGETRSLSTDLPLLDSGTHIVEIDLVSNEVAWFKQAGSKSSFIQIEVCD